MPISVCSKKFNVRNSCPVNVEPGKLILFEDEHVLVVNKPARLNTHAAAAYGGEGLYEWLRNREPRWASLAIIHRLDKETSGLMVFGKTADANRSLTRQFSARLVRKVYTLATDRPAATKEFTVKSALVRSGERYLSRPGHAGAAEAETRFRVVKRREGQTMLEAEPLTGRTHQIRVHAAEAGLPIIGDKVYGGAKARRLHLHAARLAFEHPVSGQRLEFEVASHFEADAGASLRAAMIDSRETNAWRVIHGASDGWPGWYVDQLGEFVLSQSEGELSEAQRKFLDGLKARGVYHKRLMRHVRGTHAREASPQLAMGEAAPERFTILENVVRYELSFAEGYSVGLFLDQRDNRRRFLESHAGAGFGLSEARDREVLNTFAYTCGFSVCAARAGARVTSVDLSKKYLEWGKRNFALNGLAPGGHDFIYGDAFDWMRRLRKKERFFDAIILDPPTFSQSKERGVFRADKDYGELAEAALPLLKEGGTLFASTNAAEWPPEEFIKQLHDAVARQGRHVLQEFYAPQPPDFPISREEPGYLKTMWMRVR